MFIFLKAQTASLIATFADYLITAVCKYLLKIWYLKASVIGTVAGGICHFLLGRHLVFGARHKSSKQQAYKYLLVWVGNLLLTTATVYLLKKYLNISNIIYSKILASVVLSVGYNYVLHKKFVFKQ